MSVPYFIRIFRETDSPLERKRIYQKVGNKLKSRIRKRFKLCIKCFENPIQRKDNLCRMCGPKSSPQSRRKSRLSFAIRCSHLEPHRRVCVGCSELFESRRGMNVCRRCVQQAREESARLTLDRTADDIPTLPTVVTLFNRYGHSYKPSLVPRIPLSTVDVFGRVNR